MHKARKVFFRVLCCCAWLAPAWLPASANAPASCGRGALDDAELALLEVRLADASRTRLEEIITSYDAANGIYLPLGMFSQALQFPIQVNSAITNAEGWFLNAERTFELDLETCSVDIDGRRRPVDPVHVQQMDDDIYVHVSLLETWFPVELEVDLTALRLVVTPLEPLPVQQRVQRQSQWDRVRSQPGRDPADAELLDVPYRFMDWPFVDATIQADVQQLESGERVTSNRYKLVAAGDLLRMNAQVSVAGANGEPADSFVTLSRRDPYRRLLGPLSASEFAIGDIATARDPLVAANTLGRGLHVSNRPLDRPQEFDRFNLQGELPLGWDVELYRNGQLIAFQSGDAGARYDFVDIPLEFGINNFRLVFYGPNGQVREETLQRVIGQDMIRPGEHQYHFTALQERTLQGELEPEEEGIRTSFGYDYGLTRALSFGLGARRMPLDGIEQDYYSTHVNLALPYLFTSLEHATQVNGGDAYSALLSTQLLGFDVAAESSRFNDFDSERLRLETVPGDVLERNQLRIGARLPPFNGMGLAFATEFRESVGTEGEQFSALNRISLNSRYGTATHIYEIDRTRSALFDDRRARQYLLFSTRYGRTAIRGEVVQELEPERFVRNVGISADWDLNERARLRLAANRLPMDETNMYSAGISWQFDYFSMGLSVGTTSSGDATASLVLSSSFIRDPSAHDWQLSPGASTQSGAIGVDVYLDENGDGTWDNGEPPVPGAVLRTNGITRDASVNDDGYAFIPGLPAYQRVDVSIDPGSLENPFWKVEEKNVAVVPRPGRTARIQLPVIPTGSIEGTVVVPPGGDARLAEGRRVYLLTGEGEPVQNTLSAYDGYYYFGGIRPGFYRIRLGDHGVGRRYDPHDLLVEIHGGMEVIQSVDLVLNVDPPRHRAPAVASGRVQDAVDALALPEAHQARADTDVQADGYAIQLMAASTEATVRDYIVRHGLETGAGYVRTTRNGQPWFQVLFGRHATADAARAAIQRLPPELKAAGPYIRPFIAVSGPVQRVQGRPVDRGEESWQERDDAWILARPGDNFTIQLAAMRSERDARAFMRRHDLATAVVFKSTKNGNTWYAVLQGDFATRTQAQRAASRLPSALRETDYWIRRFDGIQAVLR